MLAAEGLDTQAVSAHVAPLRVALERAIAAGEAGVLREASALNPGGPARFLALRDARAQGWKAKLAEMGVVADARDDILRIGLGLYHDLDDIARFCAAAKAL